MGGNILVEMCSTILHGLTRSVAENYYDSNGEFDEDQSIGYNPLQQTGLEWNCQPDDELIFQQYNDREVNALGDMALFYCDRANIRVMNASSPDNSVVTENETENNEILWQRNRPTIALIIWRSMYFGFLISLLSASLIGLLSILVYYLRYQITTVCMARPKGSIPTKIQWSITISEIGSLVFLYLWFFVNTLFYFRSYQIMGLKRTLFLISFFFCILDSVYRVVLQALGISQSKLTSVQRIPVQILFSLSVCLQSLILARHFFRAAGARKLTTVIWMIGSSAMTIIVGTLVATLIYPAYNKQEKTGKFYIAVFAPLITFVLKGSSRLCVQRLWRISHPGTSFLLLVPLYYGSAVMLRVLQVDLKSLKSVALIGIIHGIAEVIERSVLVLIDYICDQIYERRRLPWVSFRTRRRERLATDIAIMSMLYEASAIISVNGFLHLHEYFYTNEKTVLELLQSFVITTAVPLVIEWFFTFLTIAIETRYQNRPILAVWQKQWKRHLIVALLNEIPMTIWTSTSLLIVIQGRFSGVKDYCAMPFTHP